MTPWILRERKPLDHWNIWTASRPQKSRWCKPLPCLWAVDSMILTISVPILWYSISYCTTRHRPRTRIGAHRDFSDISLLLQGDVPCLEVWNEEVQEYYPAPPVGGAYVVNLGNLFERCLSAGRTTSNFRTFIAWSTAPARIGTPSPSTMMRTRISSSAVFNYVVISRMMTNMLRSLWIFIWGRSTRMSITGSVATTWLREWRRSQALPHVQCCPG